MTISESAIGQVQEISYELLDMSTIDEFRSEAINRLSGVFSASTCAFFNWADAGGMPEKLGKQDIHFWQLDTEYQDIYFENVFKSDPLTHWHRYHPRLRVTALSSITEPEELKTSMLYRQVLQPNKQHDVLTIFFIIKNSLLGHISLTRPQNRPVFGEDDIQLANLLAPSLSAAYSKLLLNQQLLDNKSIIDIFASLHPDRFCMILNESREPVYISGNKLTGESDHPLSHQRILASLRADLRLPTPNDPQYNPALFRAPCWDMGIIHRSMKDQYGRVLDCAFRHYVVDHEKGIFHLLSLDSNDNRRSMPAHDRYGLTKREKEIIAKVKEGLNSTEIGETLSISRWTVKNHLQSIYGKVGVNNRVSLINCTTQSSL